MDDSDAIELYRRYRPQKFSEMIGQTNAVKQLTSMVRDNKVPHAVSFIGPSGSGKTTAARILASKIGCSNADLREVDSADNRGIDDMRAIRQVMGLAPMEGTCRVWILDEFHQATSDAQSALLKALEDTPRHVYFFICTTDPQKLKPTIRTRCTEIKMEPIKANDLKLLIGNVCIAEKVRVFDTVIAKIAEVADGSARKALVLLHQVMQLATDDERLECVQKADSKTAAIEICRALMQPRPQWSDLIPILNTVLEDPEQIRHMILGYAQAVLLKGGKMAPRAFLIIQAFRDSFYTCGRPGLCAACYEVMSDAK